MMLSKDLASFLGRFRRSRSGATAVEFAIVAMPFIATMFAIFDVSLVYFAQSALENGVASAARQIRTGQAQTTNMTAAQFKALVCTRVQPLLACDDRLMIDVRKFTSFGTIAMPPPLDVNGNFTGNTQFQTGVAGDIVVARAYYAWPILTPSGNPYINMSGGRRVLTASVAFRNEPFTIVN
jgi:Flp pilus assembly protein TadG